MMHLEWANEVNLDGVSAEDPHWQMTVYRFRDGTLLFEPYLQSPLHAIKMLCLLAAGRVR